MKKIRIIESNCPKNHRCPLISICPTGAIIQNSPFEAPRIDESKCTGCGKCARFCFTFSVENS